MVNKKRLKLIDLIKIYLYNNMVRFILPNRFNALPRTFYFPLGFRNQDEFLAFIKRNRINKNRFLSFDIVSRGQGRLTETTLKNLAPLRRVIKTKKKREDLKRKVQRLKKLSTLYFAKHGFINFKQFENDVANAKFDVKDLLNFHVRTDKKGNPTKETKLKLLNLEPAYPLIRMKSIINSYTSIGTLVKKGKKKTPFLERRAYSTIDDRANHRTLVGAIIKRTRHIKKENITSIALRFEDNTGILHVRNIPGDVFKKLGLQELYEKIRTLTLTENKEIRGSDEFEDVVAVDPTFFRVDVLTFKGGSDFPKITHKNKKVKNCMNDTLLCENFPSKENNCLLEILRSVCGVKTKANKIRNELNIDIGKCIEIGELKEIEEYFGKSIGVIVESEKKYELTQQGNKSDLRESNIRKFRTKITFEDTYIYGDDKCDIQLFLRNEHYTLIKRRIEQRFCYISGSVITKKQKILPIKEIRKLFIAKGILLIEKKRKKKKVEKEEKPKMYWGFDYETYYNFMGILQPYSVACIYGRIQNDEFKEFGRFFELGKDCNKKFIKWLFENRDYTDDNILIGYNSSRFDNYLLCDELILNELLNKNSVFMAGNSILNVVFESFRCIDLCRFTCSSLATACEDFKTPIVKGHLKHSDIQNMYFDDRENFFNNLNETGLTNDMIKTIEENKVDEDTSNWTKREYIEWYNFLDCQSLMSLYCKFRKEMADITDEDIDKHMTISGLTYAFWGNSDHSTSPPVSKEQWDFFRSAVVAGRSQIFKKTHFKGRISSKDVKSLYPYIMIFRAFPIGEAIKTNKYIENKLGIYECVIKKQPSCNIIPLREKNKPLNWTYQGVIDKTYHDGEEKPLVLCSVDIENIRSFGGIVEVNHGYYWKKSSKKVFECLKPLMEAKNIQDCLKFIEVLLNKKSKPKKIYKALKALCNKENLNECVDIYNGLKNKAEFFEVAQNYLLKGVYDIKKSNKLYNPSLRSALKLLMNSLSGKVIQRYYTTDKQLCFSAGDIAKFIDRHTNIQMEPLNNSSAIFLKGKKKEINYTQKDGKPNFLGVFIYAYARTHMYKSIISKVPERLATDTDSLHAPREVFEKIKQVKGYGYYNEGNEFGDFEEEIDFDTRDCYYIAPKCYGLFGDKKNKMRFKGVGSRDKLIEGMTRQEFEKLEINEKAKLYETFKPALCEQLYIDLVNGKPVHILCSQIKKNIVLKDEQSTSYSKLTQVFMYKTINP